MEYQSMTKVSLKMIQSGCIYLFGRDRYFRPTFVVDGKNIQSLSRQNPELVNGANLCQAFVFLHTYLKQVMFLPGQIDYCNLIVNLGNMSVMEMQRETILTFSAVLQENVNFFMAKSFYLNLSWAQSIALETLKYFLQDSIRQKTILTRERSHP